MKPRIIEENGKKYAVIPYAAYEKLEADAEALDDLRVYDETRANAREYYPAELVERLLTKEHPVKIFREYRGMTQEKLAKKADVARAYIAQIEGSGKSPSVTVLKSIARALDVDLDEIA